jgi:TolB-like protein/Flp pilus assembly protein TadD
MGEVYRARDTRLERDVAIKVLPPDFSRHSEHVAQFEVEAKLLASVHHPNIASIFDLKEIDGVLYLILELVEGQSLDHHVKRGALPIADVLGIGLQVAAALDAAHAKGIVHRDLKPANVILGPNRTAKVLDFGIALAPEMDRGASAPDSTTPRPLDSTDAERGAGQDARVETATARLSASGHVVGTAPYMSPEQVYGEPLDKRSDIWSFGCLLFELLTGAAPFERRTLAATLTAVIHDEPDWDRLPGKTPPELVTLIQRCLRKDPNTRLHDIADARIEIDDLMRSNSPRRRRLFGPALAAVAVAAVLLVGLNAGRIRDQLFPRAAGGDGPALGPRSVAVRSFAAPGDTLSGIFARGLQDELVSVLAQVHTLSVVSRAATLRLDSAGTSTAEIARRLGVATVLEGNVERLGDALRISVHLVSPESQTLWSQSYTTPLAADELFAVQSDLAREIAGALRATLTEEEITLMEARPTSNLDAYAFYIRGNGYAAERFEREASSLAIDMYQQAVTIDPDFALAYARLAQAQAMFFQFFDHSQERQEKALAALNRALELSPNLLEARIARAYVSYWVVNDLKGALSEIEAATTSSADPEVFWIQGSVQRRLLMLDGSAASFRRAIELDAGQPLYHFELAVTAWLQGNLGAAEASYHTALELSPESLGARMALAIFYFAEGRERDANQVLVKGLQYHSTETILSMLLDFRYRFVLGMAEQTFLTALDTLDSGAGGFDPGAFFLGKALMYRSRDDSRAKTYFDSARVVFERSSADRPADPAFQAELGVALAGLGRADEAISHARRATTLLPVRQDPLAGFPLMINLARVQALAGHAEDAIATLHSVKDNRRMYSRAVFETAFGFASLRGRADFDRVLAELEAAR